MNIAKHEDRPETFAENYRRALSNPTLQSALLFRSKNIQKVVIVGGGSAGWMTAAYLSRAVSKAVQIKLVESGNISTIGVGEATFSTIKLFFDFLIINQNCNRKHSH